MRPGCSPAMRSRKPRAAERHVLAFRAGPARGARRQGRCRPSRSSRSSRRSRRRLASAAASTWATPSSAPRAAWRSKRRRPRCCSARIASSRSSCSPARQQRIKELVAQPYGDLVHEGQLLDPVCRDIEALLLSSQERVTGDVHVLLRPAACSSRASSRRISLMAASKGVYGEAAGEWTPTDALGFSKIVALHRRVLHAAPASARAAPPRSSHGRECAAWWSTRSPR